ncbi:BTAD domain-containing putative transcriptional regulator [Frankia sp. Cppng1_Ct_nod]|uniref:AfsR/SARP family transcriptional regulator n=1 Tax=Frankia sp. Cppng1_Ct_nod TaxID=2897162 RepID=UPI00104109D9|nr:BTAD domain-containing putative transcriptional regulator [Frankia sp. Cppng1_Ct_nod]
MRVALLGPLAIADDLRAGGALRPLDTGGPRLRCLLALLALNADRAVGFATLANALWGDQPPNGATNALQSLVSRLRRTLRENWLPTISDGTGQLVVTTTAGYRLAIDPDDVDVHRFDRLTGDGRRALTGGDPATATELLYSALDLWRGPAFVDISGVAVTASHVARFEDLRITALENLFGAELALGRQADILGDLEGLARAHPLRERLRVHWITALARLGRTADALAVFESTRQALADELGASPSPELAGIHLALLRDDPDLVCGDPTSARRCAVPAAPLPMSNLPMSNLPIPLTTFVGRDEELRQVTATLVSHRLVTLTGAGGSGKTRLAIESAKRLIHETVDEIRFVELASVDDPADVPEAVRNILEAPGTTGFGPAAGARSTGAVPRQREADVLGRLAAVLAHRRALVILDNCEHVVGAAAVVADAILAAGSQVRVLATSRERLAVTGERLVVVGPLPLPPADADPTVALRSPAVALLADRAAAVCPGFIVDRRTVGAVAEICRRLDGLPLAIELAAARLRALSPRQVATRLDDRFRLLTAGSRTALPRHQTLRAVIAWSWDLLVPAERTVARRLAVCPAGAALEAAEEICSDTALPRADVLDLLTSLVDKSLVIATGENSWDGRTDEVRYRMLDTVRVFATERLAEAGEADRVRENHARYYTRLAETAEPYLRTEDQIEWIHRLDAENDNLLAALRWAVDGQHADTAVRLGAAVGWLWTMRGLHHQAATRLAPVVALQGPASLEARARAMFIHAMNRQIPIRQDGDSAALADALLPVVRRAVAESDSPMLALAEPMVAAWTTDSPAAREAFGDIVAHPDPWTRAVALFIRGSIAENAGDAAAAASDFARSLKAFRITGDRWGLHVGLRVIAEARALAGRHAEAVEACRQALELAVEVGAWDDAGWTRIMIGFQLARAGELPGARAEIEEAARLAARHGPGLTALLIDIGRGEIERRAGNPARAHDHYRRALEARGEAGPLQIKVAALAGLGYLATADGDVERSRTLLTEAVRLADECHDMPAMAWAVEAMADAALSNGGPERAAWLLGIAAGVRGTPDLGNPDVIRVIETARGALGDIAFDREYDLGGQHARSGITTGADLLRSAGPLVRFSGPPQIRPDGEWREDHDDSRRPGQTRQHGAGHRSTQHEAT